MSIQPVTNNSLLYKACQITRLPNLESIIAIMHQGFEIPSTLSHYDIPLAELYSRHPNKRLVVGVAIFRQDPNDGKKKLLVVQRVETEDSFPLMYDNDEISASLIRLILPGTKFREATQRMKTPVSLPRSSARRVRRPD